MAKIIPIKYNITAAEAEVPRNIVDHKKEGNADDKFTIHVDGSKDAIFREISNNKTARTLAIDFNKDARLIEIIGTVSTVQ